MNKIVLTAVLVASFVTTSESFAGPLFSAMFKGKVISSVLLVPMKDKSLQPQARFQISELSVKLSNRTHLKINFKLPPTLVTTQQELTFEGDIQNNVAHMTGSSGAMVCAIQEELVTCQFRTSKNQANLRVLEMQLRMKKMPEVAIKNQLDVSRQFNGDGKAYLRFRRKDARLNYSR